MRARACPKCGARTYWCGRYDRFLCAACRVWTDEECGCWKDGGSCESFPRAPELPTDEDVQSAVSSG